MRGLVMLIMALDHVRDLCSPDTVRPEDLSLASALLAGAGSLLLQ